MFSIVYPLVRTVKNQFQKLINGALVRIISCTISFAPVLSAGIYPANVLRQCSRYLSAESCDLSSKVLK